MKALTWHGKRDVRVENVPDPRIEEPTDAIVDVTTTAICGSDLHLYEVLGPFLDEGDILGHEAMGVVQEVGSDVSHIRPGDRVVMPFNISCGTCYMCERQLYAQCETTQVREHDKGAAMFGYTKLYGSVPGAQAELLRVPMAQFGPIPVPEWGSDQHWLYLSDILPTAWQAVQYAGVGDGSTVAVLGLGPVGQFATRIAKHRGARRVIGVDSVPERLDRAASFGVDVVDMTEVDDLVQHLVTMADGRGPDATIDAVGMEAHGSPGAKLLQSAVNALPDAVAEPMAERYAIDRLDALHTAIRATRRGGTVSISGVYGGAADPMPMLEMFDRGLQIRMGQAHVRRWTAELMALLGENDVFGVDDFATHQLPLDEAPSGYEMFQQKSDGCIKIILNAS
ncbi:zinc-dependent alcohol dehydrogenase [Phytoactinopolyspora halotolerans]|uniref:Glutathione-dependent formaldehyde dehydrogenase n=1 Tax=Phytoactinopolyspora halotolerans TaxID=1981512 RepID=A0A6L9S3D7_9ACTN|nr:zinc-dependent alcohol dehydrogenase [Phytoactinopolyspora halotolerans]NED99340.1 glutathione-dependent formaldehyde dehydrogenase [Phytoactinopolyspora halotolerans]